MLKKALAPWMESVMRIMWSTLFLSRARSRPRRMDIILALMGRTFIACSFFLSITELECQMWAMVVAASLFTPPLATIQILDEED